ncbi:hypothetical protein [Methylotuvimicrobium sp. KM1]|uniref:hypothetical protein n=1 Tax=Methylotuvimicrobium sp. KM1 TaxID=3377707 RepID=UPI00384FA8B4
MTLPSGASELFNDSDHWLNRDLPIVLRLNKPEDVDLCRALFKVDRAIVENVFVSYRHQWALFLDHLVSSVREYYEIDDKEDTRPAARRRAYQDLTGRLKEIEETANELSRLVDSVNRLSEPFDPTDIADIDIPVNPLQWLNDTVELGEIDHETRHRYQYYLQADIDRLAYFGAKYVPTIGDMLRQLAKQYQAAWGASQDKQTPTNSPKSRYNDFLFHFFSELRHEAERNQMPKRLLLGNQGLTLEDWAVIFRSVLDDDRFTEQSLKDFLRKKPFGGNCP